ncbi:LysR family transcriptional regulator [Oceanobacillus sp. Castelsardo]|uniref:LysR family transcriptional regulator n=1 Tax=Oceanobacillus sp. Castelsardo TaxID=1851204 RepID=UPI0008386523|nr:LysR family transcriptional regulator [Oceanobacillus sp. Castelsardo]
MDQHLIVFIEVAERKNFTRAAEALHMTQPAVSQYVSAFEKEIGAKLIERTNKSVELNKAGEMVYFYAKSIVKEYEQMKLLISDMKSEPSGEIQIGASYTIGEYLLPKLLAKLQEQYPSITPYVTIGNTEDIGSKLLQRDIDIGLIEGEFLHNQISLQTFATDKMYLIGSSKEIKFKEKLTKNELENQTWIIREEGSGTRRMLEDFLKFNEIHPKRVITLGSTQTIKEGVESGLGISLLSQLTFQKELELHRIVKLPAPEIPIKRHFSIIKNDQVFQPKALLVFQELVKNYT